MGEGNGVGGGRGEAVGFRLAESEVYVSFPFHVDRSSSLGERSSR